MKDFIGSYKNKLTHGQCQEIIDYFEKSSNKVDGIIGQGNDYAVRKDLKDSTDLSLLFSSETHITKMIFSSLWESFGTYVKDFPEIKTISPWSIENDFNIQRYYPGQGYKVTHCEHTSKEDTTILAWMIYLNTVEDGGTKFVSYNLTTDCVEGSIVIWPSYWTHSHHGIISNTKTKYIVTGWTCFL